MGILRNSLKRLFFMILPPARRVRDHRDALREELYALNSEIHRLECQAKNGRQDDLAGAPRN